MGPRRLAMALNLRVRAIGEMLFQGERVPIRPGRRQTAPGTRGRGSSRMTAREPTQTGGRPRHRPSACVTAILGALAFLAFAGIAEARRLALVIGNDTYRGVAPLKNARSDARAVAAALRSLGFEVIEKEDLDDHQLKGVLREFKTRVEGGAEVIFYFAGHGVQFGGMNYLVPVDVIADSEGAVVDGAVPLSRVLDDLHEQKVRFALAIVDACRDNPFKSNGRALGG